MAIWVAQVEVVLAIALVWVVLHARANNAFKKTLRNCLGVIHVLQ
jgi:hypothetical protein